jgi:acyl-CoA hydrolase
MFHTGATLQMGIGAIPDATLKALTRHKRLGIHSEMFSDGIIDLIECGAITGASSSPLQYITPSSPSLLLAVARP